LRIKRMERFLQSQKVGRASRVPPDFPPFSQTNLNSRLRREFKFVWEFIGENE